MGELICIYWLKKMSFFGGGSSAVVTILTIKGEIGENGISFKSLRDHIDEAFAQRNLKAVCLVINSPGGSAVQSYLIAEYILFNKSNHSVPVYAFVEDIAASGGYLIACAADHIYVSSFSLVGSIGAVMHSFCILPLLEKIGVEAETHTAGSRKAGQDPLSTLSKKEKQDIDNILNYTHKEFIAWVEKQRGGKINSAKKEDIYSGACFGGKQSVDYGLADDQYKVIEKTISNLIKMNQYKTVRIRSNDRNFLSSVLRRMVKKGGIIGSSVKTQFANRVDNISTTRSSPAYSLML